VGKFVVSFQEILDPLFSIGKTMVTWDLGDLGNKYGGNLRCSKWVQNPSMVPWCSWGLGSQKVALGDISLILGTLELGEAKVRAMST